MEEPLYNLAKQTDDPGHPTGWTVIKKNLTLQVAQAIAANRERMSPWTYSDKNPGRIFHLIEPV